MAHLFGTDTTTAGAAGIWGPYKLSDTPAEDVYRWSAATYAHLMQLWHSPDAAAAGVSVVAAATLLQAPDAAGPFYAGAVQGFYRLPSHELEAYSSGLALGTPPFVDGWSYAAPLCEGRLYCRWLTGLVQSAGGRVLQRRLGALADLKGEGFDGVVDCCGLEAARLVGDEVPCYPIRGHILRVRAPWVTQAVFGHVEGDYNYYIIPNREWVVLGGTSQVGNWSTAASLEDANAILENCCRLLPSLRDAEPLGQWVGLRPGRARVRLESERRILGRGGGGEAPTLVVHNYGHGGSGLTLGWGCASDAVALLKEGLSL